jgi:hypothetical protein
VRLTAAIPLSDASLAHEPAQLAALAIADLWDADRKSFWRSTEHRKQDKGSRRTEFFPTVTFRSTEALLRMQQERPSWLPKQVVPVLNEAVPSLLERKENDLHSTLGLTSAGGKLNPFTLALYIDTLVAICGSTYIANVGVRSKTIHRIETALGHLCGYITRLNSNKDDSRVHPFVLFHIKRTISAAENIATGRGLKAKLGAFKNRIAECVRAEMGSLLAKHALNSLNPGEGVALAFCASALAYEPLGQDESYLLAALEVVFRFQDMSGCWPLGRIVPPNKDIKTTRDLQIPTYEIAWGISNAIRALLTRDKRRCKLEQIARAISNLDVAIAYTNVSLVHLSGSDKPSKGWCSDHAFGQPLIESWTSATVLQQLLSYTTLVELANSEAILSEYSSVRPSDPDWPSWLKWKDYKSHGEPETKFGILKYIDEKIIKTIQESPTCLPEVAKKNVSVLLFGPPGTAKTTLVKAVAEALNWPVLLLNPGSFIEKGLEYIEAESKIVFDRLQKLTRVVVLFDECDELFRERTPSSATEQVRSITAFVTASMLPKLQDLHDRGRVLFFICTNHIESMDSAIRRGGRIDHLIGVGPPDQDARSRIIRDRLGDRIIGPFIDLAADHLAKGTKRFIRGELERATDLLGIAFPSAADATARATKIIRSMEMGLTVSQEDFDAFEKHKLEFSYPHTGGGLK